MIVAVSVIIQEIRRGGVNIPLMDFAIGHHQMMPKTDDDDDDSVFC